MSFNFSTGTKTVERILRIAYGNLSIGTAMTDSVGTADIRAYIQDSERMKNFKFTNETLKKTEKLFLRTLARRKRNQRNKQNFAEISQPSADAMHVHIANPFSSRV